MPGYYADEIICLVESMRLCRVSLCNRKESFRGGFVVDDMKEAFLIPTFNWTCLSKLRAKCVDKPNCFKTGDRKICSKCLLISDLIIKSIDKSNDSKAYDELCLDETMKLGGGNFWGSVCLLFDLSSSWVVGKRTSVEFIGSSEISFSIPAKLLVPSTSWRLQRM